MRDSFGFIAYGEDELYHRGALFSALRLLHYNSASTIRILTDKPHLFDAYPVETIELSEAQKTKMSFGNRYHFGIKAAGIIELLKGCDRLFFMDTDTYPVADISHVFDRISPSHSIMRMCEGRPRMDYPTLAGKGIAVGNQILTGAEPMWNSGLLGVHSSNLPALERAYSAIEQVSQVLQCHTPEQFCIGVALAQDARTISPHRLPIRNYSTSGKKRFARQRIETFYVENGLKTINEQIADAAATRLWRTPLDLLKKQFARRH